MQKLKNVLDMYSDALLIFFIIFGMIVLGLDIYHEFQLENEIVAKSEEYVTFNDCRRIHGKYYCKN